MSELTERILSAIARADSKRPARAADVAALVGGEEAEFWAALEALTRSRQINSAHVMRPKSDPEPWLAIWPTGVVVPDGGWTGNSHRALFEAGASIREAMHASHAPKVRASAPAAVQTQETSEMAMKAKQAGGSSQAAVLDAMNDAPGAGMSCSELAAATGLTVENFYGACQGLIKRELIERVPDSKQYRLPTPIGADANAPGSASADGAGAEVAATSAETGTDVPQPSGAFQAELLHLLEQQGATPDDPVSTDALALMLGTGIDNINQALRRLLGRGLVDRRQVLSEKRRNAYVYWPVRVSTPHEASSPVRIGLWDDGSLTIIDGDDVLQYPPDVTERIARLLGVPSDTVYPLANQGARA